MSEKSEADVFLADIELGITIQKCTKRPNV
jgi:hypothetical protein